MSKPFVIGEEVRITRDWDVDWGNAGTQHISEGTTGKVVRSERPDGYAPGWPEVNFKGSGVAKIPPQHLRRGRTVCVWEDAE